MGLTGRGKGSKLMLVVEGQGLPLGLLVERAQKGEVRLAEEALSTVNVARPRPGRRPHLSGYRRRWTVEEDLGLAGRVTQAVVVRWERRPQLYLAFLPIACIIISFFSQLFWDGLALQFQEITVAMHGPRRGDACRNPTRWPRLACPR